MRLLVTAASAALIASATLSVTAVGHTTAGTRPAQVGSRGQAVQRTHLATATTTLAGADTAASRISRVASRGRFTWPLSPAPAVLRRFERPPHPWAHGHRGVDLLAAAGQPVLSAGEGIVAFSGVIAGRGVITVRHSGRLRTTYNPVDDRLLSGTVVHRGDRIGVLSPAPGHCAPLTCLHWGAISRGSYQDPLSLLGIGRPILLPLG